MILDPALGKSCSGLTQGSCLVGGLVMEGGLHSLLLDTRTLGLGQSLGIRQVRPEPGQKR
jgi:hypothetical protein